MGKRIRLNLSVDTEMADGMRRLADRVGVRTLNKLNKVILAWVLRCASISKPCADDEDDAQFITRMFNTFSDVESTAFDIHFKRKKGVKDEP